ncbi:Mitochondrial pyruvate carrier - like 1 [Theobroma cacao]|nr:Mitochondrial pyruvate carrier - like 1 [Theobroma cacao]
MAFSKFQAFYNHPAGPKTIHFWAPTFKWALNIANVVDISTKPAETVSYPQQAALACSGLIWAKYSTVITPVCVYAHCKVYILMKLWQISLITNHVERTAEELEPSRC